MLSTFFVLFVELGMLDLFSALFVLWKFFYFFHIKHFHKRKTKSVSGQEDVNVISEVKWRIHLAQFIIHSSLRAFDG